MNLGTKNEQPKWQVSYKCKYASKIASTFSILCSFVGTSLLSVILFGPRNIFDYKRVQIASDCLHYLLTTAVALGFVAILFSVFSQYSKRMKSNTARTTSIQTAFKNKCDFDDSKTGTEMANRTLKLIGQEDIKTNAFASKLCNPSQQTAKGKQDEVPLITGNNCITSLNSNKVSQVENKLVPINKKYDKSLWDITATPISNFRNFISMDTLGNNPVIEMTTSKKVIIFPSGVSQCQEEYLIKRTFSQFPGTAIATHRLSEQNFAQYGGKQYCTSSEIFGNTHNNQVSDLQTKFGSLNILK